jgi:hypothetical protein
MSIRTDFERSDVERLYRAIADREPTQELLQLVHDMFGVRCSLRPPRRRDAPRAPLPGERLI